MRLRAPGSYPPVSWLGRNDVGPARLGAAHERWHGTGADRHRDARVHHGEPSPAPRAHIPSHGARSALPAVTSSHATRGVSHAAAAGPATRRETPAGAAGRSLTARAR